METQKEYYYTYYSYEEWGMGYFGSRGCKCLPEEDINYFGSFKDKSFKPTQKIILKDDYATREEAYIDEIILQEYYKVVENPHFANRAYQNTTKFYYAQSLYGENHPMYGRNHTEETKRKMRQAHKGRKLPKEHRDKIARSLTGKVRPEEVRNKIRNTRNERNSGYGNKHSQETKNKMSKSGKGKVFWNNGEINTKSRECPGDGWVRGMIKKTRINKNTEK
jgi:DNA-binding transcriptional regulator YdaS (Cro superfamily)